MINVIQGNILDATEKYIVHQTNCVSNGASGLAEQIFRKFHYANIYTSRKFEYPDKPGTIRLAGNGKDMRFVVNLMGQINPGGPKYPDDTEFKRQEYFTSGMIQLLTIKDLDSVAFPYGIGCGLAKGNWNWYEAELNKFADKAPNVKFVLYKL